MSAPLVAAALWKRLRGRDPHAGERRLFLELTRALREHLAARGSSPARFEQPEPD